MYWSFHHIASKALVATVFYQEILGNLSFESFVDFSACVILHYASCLSAALHVYLQAICHQLCHACMFYAMLVSRKFSGTLLYSGGTLKLMLLSFFCTQDFSSWKNRCAERGSKWQVRKQPHNCLSFKHGPFSNVPFTSLVQLHTWKAKHRPVYCITCTPKNSDTRKIAVNILKFEQ